jgi:hypothetical protein
MPFYSSQRHYYLLVLAIFVLTLVLSSELKQSSKSFLVEATKVQWQGNDNVHHEAAHNAPRSQKYWDEHGIERPEYAMTDAEIIAKRRQQDGSGRRRRRLGLYCMLLIVAAIIFAILLAIGYANVTGDWDTILNRFRVISLLADHMRWIWIESVGISGHRLGSSAKPTTTNLSAQGMSDEESRRFARLARFDNPKSILDNTMKMD